MTPVSNGWRMRLTNTVTEMLMPEHPLTATGTGISLANISSTSLENRRQNETDCFSVKSGRIWRQRASTRLDSACTCSHCLRHAAGMKPTSVKEELCSIPPWIGRVSNAKQLEQLNRGVTSQDVNVSGGGFSILVSNLSPLVVTVFT